MKKVIVWICVFVVAVVLLVSCVSSCSSYESQYDKDFKNGMEKFDNDEPMTKGEHDAVENYFDYESNQGERNYEDW